MRCAAVDIAAPGVGALLQLGSGKADFEHVLYRFAEPMPIPKGTRITWTAWWDNSADNPRNPDPTKEVKWGLQTWDEMHNGWMEVVRKRTD